MDSSLSERKFVRPRLARWRLTACVLATLAGMPGLAVVRAQQTSPTAVPPIPTTAPTTVPSAVYVAPELKGRTVEDVRIVGNTTVSNAVIRNLIRTRPGEPFDPATASEDLQRVYGLKKFSNVVPRVEATATGVIVTFQVTEQRQLKQVQFHGNAHVDSEVLKTLVEVRPGEAIDQFRISVARQAIQRLYQERNYPQARVEVNQDELTRTGVLSFTIVEGPHVRVRRVRMIGNKHFTEDRLKGQIKTASWFLFFSPGRYNSDQVEDDVAAIRQFYVNHGFFDARVGREVTVSPDQTEMMVTFVIDEGTQYKIGSITFRNNHTVGERQLRAGLKMTEGRAYDSDTLKRDVRSMVRDYSKAGGFIYIPAGQGANNPDYLNIDSKTVFHKEAGTVDLIYDIHEGKQFNVGRILVRGNSKTQDKVFLRELRVLPGQRYNSAEFQDAIDRIRNTQLVTNVQITPIGDQPEVRDVLVEVKENQTAFFTVGAGFTTNAGVLGNISYEQRNFDIGNWPSTWSELFSSRAFTGAGQYFKVQLEPGTELSRMSVQFQEPYLFDQDYSLGVNLYYSTRIYEHYDEVRSGGTTTIGHRFGDRLQYSGRVTLRGEDVDIRAIDNKPLRAPEILAGQGHHTVTGAEIGFRRDTTDSILLPTRGSVFDVSYEHVGALGGQYNFDKFQTSATGYWTLYDDLLDRKTVLRTSARVGYITPDAPFFERFYAGGGGSMRGFRYRGISPRSGPDDDPIGGNFSVTGTVEVGFPLAGESLRGVVFTDIGDVENSARFGTVRVSTGVGVRLTLPIFGQVPIALDFGVPLLKARQDDTQIVSFSLGFTQ